MKKRVTVFAVLLIAILTLSIGCSKGNDDGEAPVIKDWQDSQQTVNYKEAYTVPILTAEDEEGNAYTVTFTVKTKSGYEPEIISNTFILDKFEDYYITYTAHISETDTADKVVTLKVADNKAPLLTFLPKSQSAIAGSPYELPDVSVTDNLDTELEYTLTLFAEGSDEGIPLTGGSYTFASEGKYTIRAQATDAAGNTGTKDFGIDVRRATLAGEIEDFYDELSLSSIKYGNFESAEWLDEFNGMTGVIKLSRQGASNEWPQFNIHPREAKSFYEEYDKVVIRMYLESEASAVKYLNFSGTDPAGYGYSMTLSYNRWYEFVIPISPFLDNYDNFARRDFTNTIWGETESNIPYNLYIDSLYCADEVTLTNLTELSAIKETEVTINIDAGEVTNPQFMYSIKDPSGVRTYTESSKFTPQETGLYSVDVILLNDGLTASLSFNIDVTSNVDIQLANAFKAYSDRDNILPQVNLVDAVSKEVITEDIDANFAVNPKNGTSGTASIAEGKITAEVGEYVLTISYTHNEELITRNIDIKVEPYREPSVAGEIENFGDALSLSNISYGHFADKEWLESYEGKSGVVKLTNTGQDWPKFNIHPREELPFYNGYTHVILRLYIEAEEPCINQLNLSGNPAYANPISGIVYNEWFEAEVPLYVFYDNYNFFADKNELGTIWGGSNALSFNLYVDAFYCITK